MLAGLSACSEPNRTKGDTGFSSPTVSDSFDVAVCHWYAKYFLAQVEFMAFGSGVAPTWSDSAKCGGPSPDLSKSDPSSFRAERTAFQARVENALRRTYRRDLPKDVAVNAAPTCADWVPKSGYGGIQQGELDFDFIQTYSKSVGVITDDVIILFIKGSSGSVHLLGGVWRDQEATLLDLENPEECTVSIAAR
jgi:hypothetical protein